MRFDDILNIWRIDFEITFNVTSALKAISKDD